MVQLPVLHVVATGLPGSDSMRGQMPRSDEEFHHVVLTVDETRGHILGTS